MFRRVFLPVVLSFSLLGAACQQLIEAPTASAKLVNETAIFPGDVVQLDGSESSDPNDPDSPCYQCMYPNTDVEAATCAAEEVISPLVGVIGTMQALESINILLGRGQLPGAVWLFDAQFMEWQKMTLPKNSNCPACGGGPP